MSLDPKKLALPVQPIESHKLDLSQRKPSPAPPPPTSRWVNTATVPRLHWTGSDGGCWADENDRPRHRGIGPAFNGTPVEIAQYTSDRSNRQRMRDAAQVKPKRKRK